MAVGADAAFRQGIGFCDPEDMMLFHTVSIAGSSRNGNHETKVYGDYDRPSESDRKRAPVSYRFESDISREAYEQFIEDCRMVSFTQSYAWSEVKSNWGHFHCGLYRDDVLVAVALILVKKVVAGIRFFYVPYGYVIDFENKEDLAAMTDGVRRLAKRSHAYMVKLDPYFCISDNSFRDEDVEHLFSENHKIKHENLIGCGYKHQPLRPEMDKGFQARVQIAVPLCDRDGNRLTAEQLKKTCGRTGRYFENYQTKRGVTFEITDDPARIDDLVALLKETEKRKNIRLRNREYFERLLASFKGYAYMGFGRIDLDRYYAFLQNDPDTAPEKLQKVTALKEEKGSSVILSAAIFLLPRNREGIRVGEDLYAGNALYLPGLQTPKALVFECCKFAMQKGCDYFNLNGVEGTLDDSLTTYKRNFNGRIMEFAGEYDLPTSLLYYPISIGYSAMLTLYKRRNRKHPPA